MTDQIQFKLLQIDAWRDPEGGWYWNNCYTLADDIFIDEDALTPRRILRYLRTAGFLSDYSKGRIAIDGLPSPYIDGYCIEVLDKSTREPLFALSTIH